MREIKFRAKRRSFNQWIFFNLLNEINSDKVPSEFMQYHLDEKTVCQYTGLKDKNYPLKNCVYEGDILSLDGIVIGNIYENKEMEERDFNLIIANIGTRDWRNSEKEAMDRGCSYS